MKIDTKQMGRLMRAMAAFALALVSTNAVSSVTYDGLGSATGSGTFSHSGVSATLGGVAPLTIAGGFTQPAVVPVAYTVDELFSTDGAMSVRVAARGMVATPTPTSSYVTGNLFMQWFDGAGTTALSTAIQVTDATGHQLGGAFNNPPFSTYMTALLPAGSYTLRLTGNAIGANGGGYTLFVSEVPLPAAAILFASALFGFSMFSTRRKVS